MHTAGQTTVEYAGTCLLVLVLVLGLATVAAGGSAASTGDAGALALARRHTPRLVLERGGDVELPVDFRRCRSTACAEGARARPVLFLHAVHRRTFTYLEYWEYLPDSRFAHTGVGAIDGYHHDDWEGVIVKLAADGSVVGARASAHLGWNGRHGWWDLAADDWAPYPAPVYRAAGSHAGSFSPAAIDLAGDGWNGNARAVRPVLVAADTASRSGVQFDPGAIAPWAKQAWSDPESVTTGHTGDRAAYAGVAHWWARLCVVCSGHG